MRRTPVNGGESLSSRARRAVTVARFPPAEVPPTMNPFLGSAPRLFAFLAA